MVGEVILVGNMPATVVGVAKEKQSMFGSSKTLNVWVPYSTMANRLMGNNYFDSITVRIRDGYDSKEAEQQLSRLLTLRHGKRTSSPITWTAWCKPQRKPPARCSCS